MAKRKHGSGSVRQLPSGRWQVRYRDHTGIRRAAPVLFDSALDARAWLARYAGTPGDIPSRRRVPTLNEYAEEWLATRQVKGRPLKPRTRAEYRRTLNQRILPTFGTLRLDQLQTRDIRTWHAQFSSTPTVAAHAYSLLRAILNTAVDDELLERNPCRIKGAGSTERASITTVLAPDEVDRLAAAMPARLRLMVLLTAWCGFRYGEVTELRREDLEPDGSRVYVTRAVVRTDGVFIVSTPKTRESVRVVAVPPHIRPTVVEHLAQHVGDEPGALLFPARGGGHLLSGTFTKPWRAARASILRPDLRFHDLRHVGATLATLAGASLVQVQRRLGHTTTSAAMRYQHVVAGVDDEVAVQLSELATSGVVLPFRHRSA